ncbi:ABC transporter substrate-binding protein [Brucella tritici]|uniref:ABC transporter substrate-binding protein n=1 Tax=Brucella tritici TaxID=94626 RepID=A0A833FRD0_9HYPH|nr:MULTISPECIES: ABC transporter substrate-binding protein [Brucella/Ochrobactrum group]KAB2667055.1 ABC transporter substrate-binding protein [Brucella tritici]PWU77223.1 ABC transporter substrate-binding protein [Ochrobactrum sp. POC9]
MKHIAKFIAAGTFTLCMAGTAPAAEVTLDVLYAQSGFAKFHDPISQAFMKEHPDIKIKFRAPAKDYDEGHLLMQRLAVTNQLPDLYFPGYHLMPELARTLSKRNQIVDLKPFLDAEPQNWITENYSQSMLDIGVVDGVKYGMAFNASLPILYVNESAVEKAGLDPKEVPATWDDLLARAKKIHDADPKMTGIGYTIYDWPDDWLWQTILRQEGTQLVEPETGKAGFNNEKGLAALKILRRIVTEGGENLLEFEQARQQFAAGQTAYFIDTPARLAQIIGLVGDRFKLNTIRVPIDDKENGGLPTGGAAGIILSQDEAVQKAAWEYLKFATGPKGQSIVVETTGYLPTNKLADGADYLAPFYQKEPRFKTVASQIELARPWEGYPTGSSVRIWRAERDIIAKVMRGDLTPEDALPMLVKTVDEMTK